MKSPQNNWKHELQSWQSQWHPLWWMGRNSFRYVKSSWPGKMCHEKKLSPSQCPPIVLTPPRQPLLLNSFVPTYTGCTNAGYALGPALCFAWLLESLTSANMPWVWQVSSNDISPTRVAYPFILFQKSVIDRKNRYHNCSCSSWGLGWLYNQLLCPFLNP